MNIVIATGIFIPELGGPATYAPNIAQELIKLGHQVSVFTYSDKNNYDFDSQLAYPLTRIKRGNKILNYWKYFWALQQKAKQADLVYAFDYFSAGLPALFFSKIYKKPLYIRTGGDFLWEKYLDEKQELLTLREFYEQGVYKNNKLRFALIKWIIQQARGIIFTTNFQKEIFARFYQLDSSQLHIVANPISYFDREIKREKINKEIIFAGRFNFLHNIFNLIKSFAQIKDVSYKLTLIGEGPIKKDIIDFIKKENLTNRIFVEDKLSREELRKRISQSFLVVLPALSDISPNLILECVSGKIPFISSQEIGFDWLKNKIITFDPKNNKEITEKINYLLDEKNYHNYQEQIAALHYDYSYSQAAKDTIKIFQL